MIMLDSELLVDEVVSEITLDEVYSMFMDLSSDLSGLKSQVMTLQNEVVDLQELILQKFDVLLQTLENMPQYDQLQIIIALLFMLVCFELMRMVRGWTNSFKLKGGK